MFAQPSTVTFSPADRPPAPCSTVGTLVLGVGMLYLAARGGRAYLGLVKKGMVPLEIGLLLSFVLIGLGFGNLGDKCSDGGMHCGIICHNDNFENFSLCRPWYVYPIPSSFCPLHSTMPSQPL